MSDGIDPDEIESREFSTGRRGFDRAEVEAFRAEVAAAYRELQNRLTTMEQRLKQVGITDLLDLKAEFDTVGEDVSEILQAARDAAEDIRDRANADAAARIAEAQSAAESLRGDAWVASEEMLAQVVASAEEMAAKASEDVLFVRAEAEREALRMTGDAKRDAEELARSAQVEAEKLVADARAESESMVEAAQQSADLAQERVRALEARREELMGELEAAREALAELEDTIDGRRSELTHATTDPSDTAVRVLTEADHPKPDIGDWLDEDATVRLVPPPPAMPLDPVDADELAAEVESLRGGPAPAVSGTEPNTRGSGSSAEAASLDFEITSGDVPIVADGAATREVPSPAPPIEDEPDAPPPSGEPTRQAPAAESPAPSVAASPEQGLAADTTPPAAEGDEPDIDDLFASLRSPDAVATEPEVPSADEAAPVEPAGAVEGIAPRLEEAAPLEQPAGETAGAADAAWDLRDRMIMPVTNEVLRAFKRGIVDLQNEVLEEMRTEPAEWRPKKAMFDVLLGPEAGTVASRSYLAGVAAAGELAGAPAPSLPDYSTHTLSGLVTDLWEAVVDAIDATAGGNSRERGASVGRIFRAWRTDEAERRIRQVSHAEYNAGVAAGLDTLSVAHGIEPPGRDMADPDATVVVRA